MTTEPQIRYCTTDDGASIAYETMGAGPVVIAPAGPWPLSGAYRTAPGVRASWSAISQEFTFVRYDGRGMGLSGRERREYGLEARLLDLDAVARAVDAETFALLSGSFGGLTAIACTVRQPERVTCLVLSNAFPRGEQFYSESEEGRVNDALGAVTVEQWHTVTELIGANHLPEDADPGAARARAAGLREAWDPDAFMAYRRATREIDLSAELAAISVPTLVISAGPALFEQSRELAIAIPNARLVRATYRWAGWDERDYATLVSFLSEHMPAVEAAAAPATSTPAGTSGTAIILFTDIVDSTALTERLGDTVFRAASRALDEGMRAAMREAGGTAVDGKVLGDGVMGVFTSASQAITAARRCIELSAESELRLHVGLHAGDVLHEAGNVYGGAVNIASRICGMSAPGEVLVSRTVADLARTSAGVTFEDRGEHALKGIDDAVRVYAVRQQE